MVETKNKGGRPSKYKPEFVQKVYDYVSQCVSDKDNYKLPTREGLANSFFIDGKQGVTVETIANWGKRDEAFLSALRFIDQKQKEELINRGLNNEANSTIAKLILSANHNMREKQDVTSGDKPLPSVINLVKPDGV